MKKNLHFIQFVSIIFTLFVFTFSLHAQLAGYAGEMPVVVHNNSGSTMTNCQVKVIFSSAQLITLGLMQSNGNDIRFGSDCGSSTAYNYWIEGPMNTDTTKVWVLVPSVNANDSLKIFMFFGNSGASAGSTLGIFNGPWSSTDSVIVTSTNNPTSCQRGFEFTANQNVLVTHLGKAVPNSVNSRYVTLFDYSSQAVICQLQVPAGTSNVYNYSPLTTPIWLSSGHSYVLEVFNGASGDWYLYGTSSQINSAFTYVTMLYCNTCTQNTFPTTSLAGYHYGVPDLLFYKINTVSPAPTATLGLAADTITPAAPTGLIGIPGNQQATLRWNKNTQFDLAKYFIYKNTTNNPATSTLIDSVAGSPPDTNYTATGLVNGNTYYFWVRAVDRFCVPRISGFSNVATITPVVVAGTQNAVPKVFSLHQNYPNPFNPTTRIKYDIPKGTFVTITVYDITGREVELLVNEFIAAGYHEVTFDATNLASGVYFYKIEAGSFISEKKMIVVK